MPVPAEKLYGTILDANYSQADMLEFAARHISARIRSDSFFGRDGVIYLVDVPEIGVTLRVTIEQEDLRMTERDFDAYAKSYIKTGIDGSNYINRKPAR